MINLGTLIAAGISPTTARLFVDPLNAACLEFGITTPLRQAHFIGQGGYESVSFTHLEESLWYSRAETIRATWPTRVINLAMAQTLVGKPEELANTVYSSRYGNGDKQSGDGFKYIGRGLFQLTFRGNYAACGKALGLPLEDFPVTASMPETACRTAGWYWQEHHMNALADTDDVVSVTRAINPALLGLDGRKRRTQLAMEAFA